MIKVILVDDQKVLRDMLRKILVLDNAAEVIGEAANGNEFLSLIDTCSPDVVLMDISMPDMNGIEATQKALQKQPDLKILTLSSNGDEKHYYSMIEAGAKGFVVKDGSMEEIEKAIVEVHQGRSWFSTELLRKVIFSIRTPMPVEDSRILKDNEIEILRMLCTGTSDTQIAQQINATVELVQAHKNSLLQKTGSNSVSNLIMYAIKNKIVDI